jgi:hypothetical protein
MRETGPDKFLEEALVRSPLSRALSVIRASDRTVTYALARDALSQMPRFAERKDGPTGRAPGRLARR